MSTEAETPKIVRVRIADLAVHPVAKRENYKESELKALGKSLQENGQLHPVLVRQYHGKLELLAGTRRMRAAESVGMKTINATVCRATDAQALELIGVENLLRSNLNPIERSRYIIELMRPETYGGGGLTLDEVRKRFGRSADWVRETCKLSRVPEPWRGQLASGKISEAVVRMLFQYLDKPAVLKSIERHQDRNPKQWKSREDWRRLGKMINDKFEELDQQEKWSESENAPHPDRETKAALTPDPYAEERVDRQADKVDEAMEKAADEVAENLAQRKRLTLEAAKGVIHPFSDSADDLATLNRAILERLQVLEAEESGNDE